MLRIVVTICAVSQLATALPQRPVQLTARSAQPQGPSAFGPAFTQQLAFGGPSASPVLVQQQQRARGQSTYQSTQPILLQQASPSASPASPTFANFPSAAPFGGTGRQILTLRSPQSADEDEYEYEDDDEPTIQSRPSPTPSRNVVPVTRAPVRIASPTPSLGFGGSPGRFPAQPQQQQQQVRQRQPIQTGIPSQQPQRLTPQQAAQRPLAQASPSQGNFGFDGKRSRLTTPPPIQTINRYQRQNDDGSMTWGYENEDGTFKEETLGADCVVRGKYGYIDPEGNKREYEYQTGNPCDPNKKDEPEEAEEEEDLPDGPSRGQQLAGVLSARPRPVQRRPVQGGIPQYSAQPQYSIS